MRKLALLCCLAFLACHSNLSAVVVNDIVTNATDAVIAPPGSLRAAVEDVNANGDTTLTNSITYSVPGAPSVELVAALQNITKPLLITSSVGSVIVDKSNAAATFNILRVSAHTTTIQDVVFSGGDYVVDPGATIAFNFTAATGIADTITGAGSIIKQGTSLLTLNGVNSWTGGTTVQAGTLQGDVNSLPGDFVVQGGAFLDFTSFNTALPAQTFAGAISGAGSVIKDGGNDLTFTGTSNYTGGTQVNAGRLIVDPSIFVSDTNVATGATFVLNSNSANTIVFASAVTGTGALEKMGTSTVQLTGANTYSGGTIVSGGTLQGTTTIMGNVSVAAGTTLDFTQPAGPAGIYTGVISGAGEVLFDGPGTVVFTNTQTYTGGTTISTGALDLQAQIAGDVFTGSGGTLIFDFPTTQTFAGNISGFGSVVKNQPSDLTLSGANNYSGGTTINAGRLIVDPTTYNSDTTINAGGILQLNANTPVTTTPGTSTIIDFNPSITGAGQVEKAGSSTVNLLGTYTYTGGTKVLGGALQGSTSTLQGNFNLSSGTGLLINEPATGTLNGIISGFGSVTLNGQGTVTFNTPHTYSGGTFLNSGTLILNAQLPGDISTLAGTRLEGPGGVAGDLTTLGIIQPDTAFGTMVIGGDATFLTGSQLNVHVDPSGNHSTLQVNGLTSITGATVRISADPGTYTGVNYDILEAVGGFDLTNYQFTANPNNTAFLNISVQTLLAQQVVRLTLTLLPIELSPYAFTPNQKATAAAFDQMLQGGDPDIQTVLTNLSTATSNQIPDIIDRVGADTMGGLLHPRLVASQHMADVISQRLNGCRDELMETSIHQSTSGAGWAEASFMFDELDGDELAADMECQIYGASVGFDGLIMGSCDPCGQSIRVGAAASYRHFREKAEKRFNFLTGDGVMGAVYGSYQYCIFHVGAMGYYGYDFMETARWLKFGTLDRRARLEPRGQSLGGRAEMGVRLPLTENIRVLPLVYYDDNFLRQSGRQETGGHALNLTMREIELHSRMLSARTTFAIEFWLEDDYAIEPEIYGGWGFEMGDRNPPIRGRFTSAPEGTGEFVVHGARLPHDTGLVGAKIGMSHDGSVLGSFSYDGKFSNETWTHTASFIVYLTW